MIEVEMHRNVGVLRMAHGKANAMDTELCEAITARLEEHRHSSMQALVLTGQGQIFSAGVDLLRVLDGGAAYLERFLPALSKAFETLFCFPKPVVAAINGHAIAGGCVLACAADYRIMARESGRIGVPELLVGIPFPTIAVEIMRCASAPKHFQTLLYSGATLSPEDAAERALVNETAESTKLLDLALAKAESLAALPAAAFDVTKRQIHEPIMRQVRDNAARFDATVRELWASPAGLAAIRGYVDRTFKRPQK
jgi:enoyl-CoA hydratase